MEKDQKIKNIKEMVKKINKKKGRQLLTEYEILVLASEEIAHTYTYKEKNYSE